MSTFSQCVKKLTTRYRKPNLSRTPRLRSCPAAKGLVVRVVIMTPKKPNSAQRHVAKVKLYRKPRITARIPGQGTLVSRFNRVLVRGGRANDLPGIGYSLVRGVYDFPSLSFKKKRRSFYGAARQEQNIFYIRKKVRKRRLQQGY